ncbi:MAG: hypothetical protein IPL19_29590 [Sandaracinaceae bacterium]|nr:hypothetical protein [Sandaracinaceae bacterium]
MSATSTRSRLRRPGDPRPERQRLPLAVGYATQAEAGNNDWGHFIDVVATIGLTDGMKLVLNADLRFNPHAPR